MVDMTQLQAIYGGTFDPVHYGHLKPVEITANQIGLSKVIIMPNNVPPHRPQPEATSAQRVHMLKLAIADKPLFTLDERELRRDTPSGRRKRCRSGARAGAAQTAGVYHWRGFATDLSHGTTMKPFSTMST